MSVSESSKLESKYCILKAAAKLFAKFGLDKCSTREIAKKSDTNISLISYYFGGKEGLYKEVMYSYALQVKETFESLLKNRVDIIPTRENFLSDMDQIIDVVVRLRLQNPEISKIFAREKLAGFPHSKKIHEDVFYPLAKMFFELFEKAQKAGIVKAEINAALFMVTMTEGIWGYFEMMECQTQLSQDCDYLKDINELKNQLRHIYLTGVLL